ncbi:MAG: DNA polymerase III subunit alpha, partial [Clostridia bacterium]|nr:DNA polymerase III subunit alpha [Clostridia bacterium]
AERDGFVKGAAERGVSPAAAEALFDRMQSFAEYAFNKSHAAAYATHSFRTAYLKAHYPREYMAALLTSVLGDMTKTAEYIAEATRYGIAVLPPDINESRMTFSVSGNDIRFGLLALRNVGRPFVEAILAERAGRPFTSFADFLERMSGKDLNRRQVEALIKCGAFDRLGVFRSRLLSVYEAMIDEIAQRDRAGVTGQLDIFSMDTAAARPPEYRYPDIPEFGIRELLTLEKESSGMYFSGHIIEDYQKHMKALSCTPISEILDSFGEEGEGAAYTDGARVTVGGVITRRTVKNLKNGSTMGFITLEDRYGEIDGIVFSKTLESLGRLLVQDAAVAVTGKLSLKEGEKPEVIVMSVTPLRSDTEAPPSATGGPRRLFLRVPSLDSDACRMALRLLERYRGDIGVAVYDASSEKYVTVSDRFVSEDPELLGALYRVLGRENVVLR